MQKLRLLGVIVIGDHGEFGDAAERGELEIGLFGAGHERDAVFVFGRFKRRGVVGEELILDEVFEVADGVLAEVDAGVVAQGVEHFKEGAEVLAFNPFGVFAESRGGFFSPPRIHDVLDEAGGKVEVEVGQGAGSEGFVAGFGDGVGGELEGGGFELGGDGGGFRQVPAPIGNEGNLTEVGGGGGEGPGDGATAVLGLSGGHVIEGVGEAGFGHGCATGDEGVELIPTLGLAIVLSAEAL